MGGRRGYDILENKSNTSFVPIYGSNPVKILVDDSVAGVVHAGCRGAV